MTKAIDVETLLRWAYRDELPKKIGWIGGGAISPGFQFVDLGVRVDDWSKEPGFPIAMGMTPHPDAVEIEKAVNGLCTFAIEWPMAREWLAPDCGRFIADDEVMVSSMSFDLRTVVACRARIGERPDWTSDPWSGRKTIGPNSRPVVIGMDNRRRYQTGAYCPLIIEPDPREVVADRATYAAWYEALIMLTADLKGRLCEHVALPPRAPPRPWVTGEQKRVILDDLRPAFRQTRRRERSGVRMAVAA